jgi:hypothetical protein
MRHESDRRTVVEGDVDRPPGDERHHGDVDTKEVIAVHVPSNSRESVGDGQQI